MAIRKLDWERKKEELRKTRQERRELYKKAREVLNRIRGRVC